MKPSCRLALWLEVMAKMETTEIKKLLSSEKINEDGEVERLLGDCIIENARRISLEINEYMAQKFYEKNEYNRLENFSKQLDLISWCHPIITKQVDASQISRLASMFCGPFFTSEGYPWPHIDGRYAEPIVQINLNEIAAIAPIDFGTGMLQLWADEFSTVDFFIRIIPRSEIFHENITPVPECIEGEYYGEVRWGIGMLAWPEDAYPKRMSFAYKFSDVDRERLSWPGGLQDKMGWVENELKDAGLLDKIQEFVSIFPYDHPATEPHFFGSFDAIQYDPVDTDKTFLALEGEPCFEFTGGNGQITYHVNESGEVKFGFNWSCQ